MSEASKCLMNKTRSKWSNDAVIWNIFGKSSKWRNHHTVNRILSHFPSETRAEDKGDGLRILRATAKDPTEAWGHLRWCLRPVMWAWWPPSGAALLVLLWELSLMLEIYQMGGGRWEAYEILLSALGTFGFNWVLEVTGTWLNLGLGAGGLGTEDLGLGLAKSVLEYWGKGLERRWGSNFGCRGNPIFFKSKTYT